VVKKPTGTTRARPKTAAKAKTAPQAKSAAGPKTARSPRGRQSPGPRPAAATPRPPATFASLLHGLTGRPAGPVNVITMQAAPMAHLEYEEELKFKDRALAKFWQEQKLPGQPEPVIGSPRPRAYRTTSKRRGLLRGSTLYLVFGDKLLRDQKRFFLDSPLEPPEHTRIYSFLQRKLSEPGFKLVASHLNHLIIRGNYEERVVIFNVRQMTGPLVRKLKILAGQLEKLPEPVAGAFVYLDPTGSDYYLESRRPVDNLQLKKLYGPAHLTVRHGGCRFNFHPTSFSQVNESIVGIMLEKSRELLAPEPGERLIDLYCGYGLFSHYLAAGYQQVTGIDAEGPSIRAAQDNAKLNSDGRKTRFLARRITPKAIADLLPLSIEPTALLLDPPRQGPQRGVIAAIGERQPGKVLHIFCGVDQIPESLGEWRTQGYRVERIVPLDMFPGTANLEVLVRLAVTPR
jgi:tRNA/tmRNA/rRNA uracil-C5-methylase (TrmA/RlmC/RlmD family)